jgi:hypothetical protein
MQNNSPFYDVSGCMLYLNELEMKYKDSDFYNRMS